MWRKISFYHQLFHWQSNLAAVWECQLSLAWCWDLQGASCVTKVPEWINWEGQDSLVHSMFNTTRATTRQNQLSDCVSGEDSDQPGHPPSLIRIFAVRMKKDWVLSYPLSAQRRLWSDWADAQADLSLRSVHTHFVFFLSRRGSHIRDALQYGRDAFLVSSPCVYPQVHITALHLIVKLIEYQ